MILVPWQVNEEASDKVLEVEQKYNEIRRPVYNKRNEIIKGIPDFWLTAVCIHPLVYLFLLCISAQTFNGWIFDNQLTFLCCTV